MQTFGLRMSCKQCKCDYIKSLLARTELPTLKARRIITKLCYLAKTLHGAVQLPIHPFPLPEPRNMHGLQITKLLRLLASPAFCEDQLTLIRTPIILIQLPCGTSYIPPAVRASPSLRAFKRNFFVDSLLLILSFIIVCVISLCFIAVVVGTGIPYIYKPAQSLLKRYYRTS